MGLRGRQSIGRGRARTTPGSLNRDQSPIANDRRRARTSDRVDASAWRFARRSDVGPPLRRHFFPRSRVSGPTQPPNLSRIALTRTFSGAQQLKVDVASASTPVLPSTWGIRCRGRRRRLRLEARVPLRALVSLEGMYARPRTPEPTRFARRCEGRGAGVRRRDGAPPRTTRPRWSLLSSWKRSRTRRRSRQSTRPSTTSTRPRACGTSPRSSTRPPRRRSRRAARGFALQRR